MLDLSSVREMVSARDAAEALGLRPNRQGRCRCVWHDDNNPSLKVYDGDKGCYCFACHNGGDVITLTQQALGVPLREAVAWLNGAFRLGLDMDGQDDRAAKEAARKAAERRKRARKAKDAIRAMAHKATLDALSVALALDESIDRLRPRTYGEDFSEDFCKALAARERLMEAATDAAILTSEVYR